MPHRTVEELEEPVRPIISTPEDLVTLVEEDEWRSQLKNDKVRVLAKLPEIPVGGIGSFRTRMAENNFRQMGSAKNHLL